MILFNSMEKAEVKKLFDPQSIAIIGASNIPGKWGFAITINIVSGGYKGKIYPVNPSEKNVLGFKTFSSIEDLPQGIDLALITIPAEKAIDAVRDCGKKGIRWVVVISSDFAESGEEGRKRQERLVEVAREYGVKIIGPNTMGIYSGSSSLHALGSPFQAKRGKIALVSQSGNIGVQIMGLGERIGLGFSRFFGSGNEALLYAHHYIDMLIDDDETEIIALYVEGIRDGKKFYEAVRRAVVKKPVIILKSATTSYGARAALSHTGAMATDTFVTKEIIKQSGAIEVQTTEEMIEVLSGFSLLPVPKGKNVCIISMGGGWAVVAAEACDKEGLNIPPLPPEAKKGLDEMLPPFWSKGNPVDLVGTLRRRVQLDVLSYLSEFDDFDAFIIMGYLTERFFSGFQVYARTLRRFYNFFRNYTKSALKLPFLFLKGGRKGRREMKERGKKLSAFDVRETRLWRDEYVVEIMKKIMREKGKPVIAVSGSPEASIEVQRRFSVLVAPSPERAAFVLSKVASYGERAKALRNLTYERIEIDEKGIRGFLNGKERLDEYETRELLKIAGLSVVEERIVRSEEEAVRAGKEIGFPVVMKIISPDILHKTELGLVKVGIENEEGIKRAFREIMDAVKRKVPEAVIKGVSIQRMVKDGVELIAGFTEERVFGKILLFGSGGIATELYRDVCIRIPPLSLEEIKEMINEPKISKFWKDGFRGKRFSPEYIERVILILSEIAVRFPEIKELEINPFILNSEGAFVVDALCVLK